VIVRAQRCKKLRHLRGEEVEESFLFCFVFFRRLFRRLFPASFLRRLFLLAARPVASEGLKFVMNVPPLITHTVLECISTSVLHRLARTGAHSMRQKRHR